MLLDCWGTGNESTYCFLIKYEMLCWIHKMSCICWLCEVAIVFKDVTSVMHIISSLLMAWSIQRDITCTMVKSLKEWLHILQKMGNITKHARVGVMQSLEDHLRYVTSVIFMDSLFPVVIFCNCSPICHESQGHSLSLQSWMYALDDCLEGILKFFCNYLH